MTTPQVQVGDKVIYLKGYGQRPVEDYITRVTPKGWIRITTKPATIFKYGGMDWYNKIGPYKHEMVFPYSIAKWEELTKQAQQYEAQQEVKKFLEEHHRAEIKAQRDKEMAEFKNACHDVLPIYGNGVANMADGCRIYLLGLPIKPCYQERKKGYELLIVRCMDTEEPNFHTGKMEKKVAAYATYCNGANQSLPSCYSSNRFDTDEEALWYWGCQVYHSGH